MLEKKGKEKKGNDNPISRDDAHNILRTVCLGDGPGHPGYSKENNAPSEALETKCSLPREHKVHKTKSGTVRMIPGSKKGPSGTLTLLSPQHVSNQLGEHRLSKGENGTRNGTAAKLPGPSPKQPQDMAWVEVVRAHNRKV